MVHGVNFNSVEQSALILERTEVIIRDAQCEGLGRLALVSSTRVSCPGYKTHERLSLKPIPCHHDSHQRDLRYYESGAHPPMCWRPTRVSSAWNTNNGGFSPAHVTYRG
ncbi:hypothetical protein RSOL_042850 [Rhizoctonia solani AG-3 Rhs1AP]|uniref:Uncharacterized protein n=1 Tax=Rhizoctonia solani AG-3 Rhs1AP TaxID=1086054 RepID=X8IX73_9AGAM|nr:hypothetical protein RSOL_042850 [Rhizoctonia solani AG-3 Rhs1AP]